MSDSSVNTTSVPVKRSTGRPKKSEIAAKKTRNAVGRPKGDAAIMNDYKARMLASPKSRKVLDSIFNAALDDEHKNQAAAWKLLMDRMMPVSMFEKEVGSEGSSKPMIQINVGTISPNNDGGSVIDAEVVDNGD